MPHSNIIKKSLAPDESLKKSFSLSPTHLKVQFIARLIKWFILLSLITFILSFLQNNLDFSWFVKDKEYNLDASLNSEISFLETNNDSFYGNLNSLTSELSSVNILIIAIFFYLLIILPLIFFYCFYYLKISHEYILTDKRLIIKKGWLSTNTLSVRYSRITDIKVTQGFIDKILKLGTISINTAGGEDYEIVLPHISKPYDLKQELHVLKEGYLDNRKGDASKPEDTLS